MGVLIVVVMFQANFYMALGKNDLTRNVPPAAILKIIFLETPGFLSQTLPIAVSLAASLAVSRFSRESELTALRSGGTRVLRFLLPVVLFGLFVGAMDYWVIDKVTPSAARKSKELQTNVNILSSIGDFMTNIQIRLQSYTVNFGSVTKDKSRDDTWLIKDVVMFERPEPGQTNLIMAPEGTYQRGLWTFQNARTFKIHGTSKSLDIIDSRVFQINQKVIIQDLVAPPAAPDLGISALRQRISDLKKLGQNTRSLEIEYQNKFSFPAMCIIFSVVAATFKNRFAKQGGFIGVLISMGVVMIYFNAWVISTQIIGKNPAVDPFIAAWLPNFLFLAAGIIGLRSLE